MPVKEEMEKVVASAKKIVSETKMEFDALPGRAGRLYLMAAQANNGKIDLTEPTFSQNKDNFTKGNAGVHATKNGADKRAQKLIDKGADPKLFEEVENNYQKARDILETKTSSVEGVKELMIESIKNDAVMNSFSSSMKKLDGKIEQIGPSEKRPIVQQLKEQINIDNDVLENYIKSPTAQSKGLQLSKELLYKTFGAEGKDSTLDASKFTPENLKKFGQELSSALSQEANSPHTLIQNTLNAMQKEQNINIAPKRAQKINNAIAPALAKLDPQYLKEHKKEIIEELTKSLSQKKTVLSNFRKDYAISSKELDKIAEKIANKHTQVFKEEKEKVVASAKKIVSETKMEFDALPGRAGRLYLMAAQANNGKIDLTEPTFSQNKDNFTKGNAGVHATKNGADKRAQKLIDKGADPKLFEEVEKNYQKARDILETKTSSVEGVKELMIESIKNDAVMNTFPSSMKKPDGKIEQIGPSEKRPIVQQLKEQINIDNDVLENYIQSPIAQSKGMQLSKELLYKTFGAEGKDSTLDASKFTPENFKKFGQELSSALSQEAASQAMTWNGPDTKQKSNIADKATEKHSSAPNKENANETKNDKQKENIKKEALSKQQPAKRQSMTSKEDTKKEASTIQQQTKRQSAINIALKIRHNLQKGLGNVTSNKTTTPPTMSKQAMKHKNSGKGQVR